MPTSTASLREYRAADAPFVAELARSAFGEYSPRAGAPSVRAATLPGTTTLVAVVANVPVGFATLSFHRTRDGSVRASLDAIAVEAAERGKGLGKLLLAGVELRAREHGAVEITLVTAEANLAALDRFLSAGYAMQGRLERYYPRGQNAVRMRKELAH
jgi:ribosomal protein S18 acetylase RimI-like enzyme